ncbi:hypothetical protein [Streptomyces spinosirectus]
MVGVDAAQLCTYAADFTRLVEVGTLARKVATEHPRLDGLVDNASVAGPEPRLYAT